jgi:PAS domain S-box-containing protein
MLSLDQTAPVPLPTRADAAHLDHDGWRHPLLHTILLFSSLLGLVVCGPSAFLAVKTGEPLVAVADVLALLGIIGLFWAKGLPFRLRAALLCGILFLLGAMLLLRVGPVAQIYLFSSSILTTILLGRNPGLLSAALNTGTLALVVGTGEAAPGIAMPGWEGNAFAWMVLTLNFTAVNLVLVLALGNVLANLDAGLKREQSARRSLERSEQTLRESAARFRLLSSATNDALWDWDIASDEMWWSEGLETLFRYRKGEVRPTLCSWFSRIHPGDCPRVVPALRAAMDEGLDYWSGEYRFRRGDGSWAWVMTRAQILSDDEGRPLRIVGGMTDRSDRRAAEQQLAEQAALLEQAQDAILMRDLQGRTRYMNKKAENLYGWSRAEALGQYVGQMQFAKTLEQLVAATDTTLATGSFNGELEQVNRLGQSVLVEARWTLLRNEDGTPDGILAINTDITEKKRLEQLAFRSQRLESVGTLAGGIAHDLNNIITPILMSAGTLREEEEALGSAMDPDRLQDLVIMETCAKRASDLVRQILGFARGYEGQRTDTSVAGVIADVQKMVKETFPKGVQAVVRCPSELPLVRADPTQLHQVLMNLAVNARDAMDNNGTLTMSVEETVFDDVYAGMHPEAAPGPYLCLQVTDTGKGMEKAVLERIFEPFFTTKSVGQGTGLGLSTTHSIIKSHGGFITAYSERGKGTSFRVYLPISSRAAVEEPAVNA